MVVQPMLLDQIAEHMKDGRWHNVRSLARELDEPEEILRAVLEFCTEFGFATLDVSRDRARLNSCLVELF